MFLCMCKGEEATNSERQGWGKRVAALMHGRRVITIMRMDVFIVSCVSHSSPFHPLLLPPSFSPLAHLSCSVCVLHLADQDLILTLLLCTTLYVWAHAYVSYLLPPISPPPPQATHQPLWQRPVVAMGE